MRSCLRSFFNTCAAVNCWIYLVDSERIHETSHCSVFNHLLDDCPLAANEASSSVLVATSSQGKGNSGGSKLASSDTEKGLLMLISADAPGLQVLLYLFSLLMISM